MNLNNAKRIKIPIHNVEIGMTVAEDILSGNGLLLIAKGTQINENNLVNLRLYQIFYIYIYDLPKAEEVITRDIINKPGKLTDNEFELIKRHTIIGYELIKEQDFPEDVKLAVLQHHERFDGTGYPNGLTNDKLSSVSKIVAIMDIYDALTSDCSYHKRMCPFKVIKTMEKDGYNALDTGYIYIFFERIA